MPLVASVDGALAFPAFRDAFGLGVPAPPAGASWKDWWFPLDPRSGGDWAVMLPRPCTAHPFGVDAIGRDLLARALHGAHTAALVALGSRGLALTLGVPLGALAGLGGPLLDRLVLRVIEIFTCFPALLAVAAFLGGSTLALVRDHLAPQVAGPVAVTAAFLAADAILIESTLTFLGLGAGLGTVSSGAMLDAGRPHAATGAWHVWVVPAVAIAITVLALHGVGDRVRLRSASAAAPG